MFDMYMGYWGQGHPKFPEVAGSILGSLVYMLKCG